MQNEKHEGYKVITEKVSDDEIPGLCNLAELYYLSLMSFCFVQKDPKAITHRLAMGTLDDGSTCMMLLKKSEENVPGLGPVSFGKETALIISSENEDLKDAILLGYDNQEFQYGRTLGHFDSPSLIGLSTMAKHGLLSTHSSWMYKKMREAGEAMGLDVSTEPDGKWYQDLYSKLKEYVLSLAG